jgi:ATP-dependent DNA helicase RecG
VNLLSPVSAIPGVGTKYSSKLQKLGIFSIFDLLYHLPFRYEDRSRKAPISTIQAGEIFTVEGLITSIKNEFTKSGKFIQLASITDSSGSINVIWFNQTFLVKSLKNRRVSLYGKVEFYKNKPSFFSPDYEFLDGESNIHTGRIIPVYPETAGVSSRWIRSKIFNLLQNLPDTDPWPAPDLPNWKKSLTNIHFPSSSDYELPAMNYKLRLAFDELFLLQLRAYDARVKWTKTRLAHPFKISDTDLRKFCSLLPFTLTGSQVSSISQILSDLASARPMNRLLEGDVGSGKTVVAAAAAHQAHLNGFQSIFLAPTQILAYQHFQTLTTLFKPFGIEVSLITGNSLTIKQFNNVIVGTHALLSDKNKKYLHNVGLVIIDEQHRFGVLQRRLASMLGNSPHVLTMTATPIPRSVALTMFGDLDLSLISEKPQNRIRVKTWLIPESKRTSSYTWISSQLKSTGSQMYWVCPFINQSETIQSVKSAASEFTRLKNIFPEFKIGLLHGKLKSTEKTKVINDFRSGDIQILVCTPIVEIGLDIQNASIMVIEASERFGLASLHQLRGRVGRGDLPSFCLLFTTDQKNDSRLRIMQTIDSGTELAEADLKFRGAGEIYGTAQHGIPQFKIATYNDLTLITQAKTQAETIYPGLSQYPVLQELVKTDKIAFVQPN